MGSGASKPEGPIQIPDHVTRIGFPHSLHLTWKKSWSKQVVIVSTHKGSQPLYAASMPIGFPGPTVLYPGEEIEGPPMGYVDRKHNDFTIQLPGVPMYGIMPSQAAMKCEHPYSEIRYTFTMPVGNGQNQHFESFEWRHSSGQEVKSLGLSGTGWKLVRTTPGANQNGGHGFSSDGKEVVAIFAPAKSLSMSLTDIGGFQFFGSGASPEMGYHWALMALLSAIALFQHQSARQQEQNTSAASVNAASAAAAAAS